jgi:hypothetical protein
MQELEATWGRAVSVWWLLAWRGLLGAVVLGAVVGFAIGFGGSLAGMSEQAITTASTLVSGLIGLAWAVVVTRMALRKQYNGFRLAIVHI